MNYKINQANIKEWAANYDGELFDGILCDPPYELGFMGKSWDSSGIAFDSDMWRDILKLLKPGGHLLAFSGSRTYHRMAVAIEDAGFEIRDQLIWMYGSGFPKSLNIGKAVDKIQRGDRVITLIDELLEQGYTLKQLGEKSGIPSLESSYRDWTTGGHRPEERSWERMLSGLGFSEEDGLNIVERRIVKLGGGNAYTFREGDTRDYEIKVTKGTSDWEGYGTALKPAHEPCVLARKPLDKGMTVAGNVLKHGAGGLNIDGTRIGTETLGGGTMPDLRDVGAMSKEASGIDKLSFGQNPRPATRKEQATYTGRFPANLIHDGSDEVEAVFPQTKGSASPRTNTSGTNVAFGTYDTHTSQSDAWGDSGSASRYFYTAKASKRERNAGLEGFEATVKGLNFGGELSGSGKPINITPNQNHHPTVKPLSLTKYLATLIKPPTGGRLLVPFSGSGSEMIGALQAGWEHVEGVELTEEYIPIAEARIKYWTDKTEQTSLL